MTAGVRKGMKGMKGMKRMEEKDGPTIWFRTNGHRVTKYIKYDHEEESKPCKECNFFCEMHKAGCKNKIEFNQCSVCLFFYDMHDVGCKNKIVSKLDCDGCDDCDHCKLDCDD